MLEATIQHKINSWLTGNYDEQTKQALNQLIQEGAEETLTDSFYKDLEFGTGGLRGLMGVGSNRMNKYTVGAATQGLSNYLLACFPGQKIRVALAHDSRNNSQYFTEIAASVFSANSIEVYRFTELRPTPLLSFTIRHLGCKSGVVITASHNPKEYNGYKAYWDDGAQVLAPHDKNIITEVEKISSVDQIKFDAKADLIYDVPAEVEEAYLAQISKLAVADTELQAYKNLPIVYTPLHGTGITLVPKVLDNIGFGNVTIVEAQAKPDGNFPTVVYPNPEEKEALDLAIQQAKKINAELVLATDPDADRVGIAVKNDAGEYIMLNGNQTGALLVYYLLKSLRAENRLNGNEYIVKTIVTTYLIDKIAADYGVKCYNTLTGFKYIAEIIRNLEGKATYLLGCEESYGYSIGDFVRDKDAITTCAILAELAAFANANGSSMYGMLLTVYEQYGFYKEDLISITKTGKSGAEEIEQMMLGYRENPPAAIGGERVEQVLDYKLRQKKNLLAGTVEPIELPASNVLQFITEKGTIISARPSGTEPKIKFYVSVNFPYATGSKYTEAEMQATNTIQKIKQDLLQLQTA